MNEDDKKILRKLMTRLKESVGDPEKCHSVYDEILEFMASVYDQETFNKMRKIVKNVDFWYA